VLSRLDKQLQELLTIPQAEQTFSKAVWDTNPPYQCPSVPPLDLFNLSWLDNVSKKPSVKADLVIFGSIVTVSG